MVYISNGKVQESPPWSMQRLLGLLWGVVTFIILFFKTLVGLDTSSGNNRNGRGGSSGQGPGNGPGGGPKRIGRITTIDDCSMPGGG